MHAQKKAKADVITDEQGRRRFHGAFTGGFSAGHFNTVGSVEGWKPKTFVSSRSQRAPRMEQRVQDLMDSEDGFLGGVLATKEEFDTFGASSKDRLSSLASQGAMGSAIPGPMPAELIVASSSGIGQRLLKIMGWKEGQGVGSRRVAEIPDGVDVNLLPERALHQDREGRSISFAASNNTNSSVLPAPKADMYGLGFDRSMVNPEMAAYLAARGGDMTASEFHSNVYRVSSLFNNEETKPSAANSMYSGFAIDDDDDSGMFDGTAHVSALPGWQEKSSEEPERNKALSAAAAMASRQRCVTDGRPPLHGFSLALRASDAFTAPTFLPPLVPDGFKPRGPPPPLLDSSNDKPPSRNEALKDEEVAPALVAAPKSNSSVFSLLGAAAKEKMLASIRNTAADTPELREKLQAAEEKTPLVASVGAAPAFIGMAEALQNRFAPSVKPPSAATITEKPLVGGRASRFEAEGLHHPSSMPTVPAEEKLSEPPQVSVPRRILPPSRTTVAWLPARLLSKRMNVAVPSISPDLAMHTSVSSVASTNAAGSIGTSAPSRAREEIIFDEHIRKYAGNRLFATALNSSGDTAVEGSAAETVQNQVVDVEPTSGAGGDVEVRMEDVLLPPRPPISLFKSIFEDSSDSESEDEEQEEQSQNVDAQEATPSPVKKNDSLINEDVLRKKAAIVNPVVDLAAKDDTSPVDIISEAKIVFNKPSRVLGGKRDAAASSTIAVDAATESKRRKTVIVVDDDEEGGLTIRPCNAKPRKPSAKMRAPPVNRYEVDNAVHHLSANKLHTSATIGKLASLLQTKESVDEKRRKKESKKKSKKKKHKSDKKKSKKRTKGHSSDSETDSGSSETDSDQ